MVLGGVSIIVYIVYYRKSRDFLKLKQKRHMNCSLVIVLHDPKNKKTLDKSDIHLFELISNEDDPNKPANFIETRKKLNVFIVFGQHAREMVTTELSLNILKYLN